MPELEAHIKRVNEKLQLLLKKYELAQKENQRLIKNLTDKKEMQQALLKQIDTLQEQVSILKAATLKMDDADKKEFEKRINQYIKGVDQCISLINE